MLESNGKIEVAATSFDDWAERIINRERAVASRRIHVGPKTSSGLSRRSVVQCAGDEAQRPVAIYYEVERYMKQIMRGTRPRRDSDAIAASHDEPGHTSPYVVLRCSPLSTTVGPTWCASTPRPYLQLIRLYCLA